MQLAELLNDWPCTVKGSVRCEVMRIEDHTSEVTAGTIFVARKGKASNGITYIPQAISNGAVAIVVDDEHYYNSAKLTVPLIWVPNTLSFLAYSNAKMHHFPAEVLTIIAVTGTNGKTTVTHLIGQLLQKLKQQVMVIGTNGVYVNGKRSFEQYESLTTLQPKQLQTLFHEAVKADIRYVVLEASSIGLHKHRLDYSDIDIGVFLNVTEDHLEDHGSMENYKLAKQILATMAKQIIVNSDDVICRSIGFSKKGKRSFFGKGQHVDYFYQVLFEGTSYTTCLVQYKDEKHVVHIPFVGDYQCSNVLAAISVLVQLQYPLEQLCSYSEELKLPEGRFERIHNDRGLEIIIDYAHTPDAMKQLLLAVKRQAKQRVIVVFSCGGDRDQAKRPKMGMIASIYADMIVLTTDNARNEDPQTINAQIQQGFSSTQIFHEVLDRKQAIYAALKEAKVGDTVVILGKGHEKTQQIGKVQSEFSDQQCVMQFLQDTQQQASNDN